VHGAERETTARQGAIERGDAEWQDAMPDRLFDTPDAIAKREEAAASRAGHALGTPLIVQCCRFVLIFVDCQSASLFR